MGSQIRVERLDHHPLARGDLPKSRKVVSIEGSSIGVRTKSSRIENALTGRYEVVDGRGITVVR
jgi:hypothetical protein